VLLPFDRIGSKLTLHGSLLRITIIVIIIAEPLFSRVEVSDLREDPLSVLGKQAVFLSLKGHAAADTIELEDYSVTYVYTDSDGDDMLLDTEEGLAAAMEEAAEHGGKLKLIANVKHLRAKVVVNENNKKSLVETESTQGGAIQKKFKTSENGFVIVANSNNNKKTVGLQQPFIHGHHQCAGCGSGNKPIIGLRFVSQEEDGSELSWCETCQPEGATAAVNESDLAFQMQWRRQHRELFRSANMAFKMRRREMVQMKQLARKACQSKDFQESQKLLQEALGEEAPVIVETEATTGAANLVQDDQLCNLKLCARRGIQALNLNDCKQWLIQAMNGDTNPALNPEQQEMRRLKQYAREARRNDDIHESRKLIQDALGDEAPKNSEKETTDEEGKIVYAHPKKQVRHMKQCLGLAIQAKALEDTKKFLSQALEDAPPGPHRLEMQRIKKLVRRVALKSEDVQECQKLFVEALGAEGSGLAKKEAKPEDLGRLKQFARAALKAKGPAESKKLLRDALEGEIVTPVAEMESLVLEGEEEEYVTVDPSSNEQKHEVHQEPIAA